MRWSSDILFDSHGLVLGCVRGYRGYVNVEPHERGDQLVRDFTTKARAMLSGLKLSITPITPSVIGDFTKVWHKRASFAHGGRVQGQGFGPTGDGCEIYGGAYGWKWVEGEVLLRRIGELA